MRDIGEIMGEVLKGEGLEELNELVRIRTEWANIVGVVKGKNTIPYKMEDKRLYFGAGSHAWVQELHYEVDGIKRQIKELLGVEVAEIVYIR